MAICPWNKRYAQQSPHLVSCDLWAPVFGGVVGPGCADSAPWGLPLLTSRVSWGICDYMSRTPGMPRFSLLVPLTSSISPLFLLSQPVSHSLPTSSHLSQSDQPPVFLCTTMKLPGHPIQYPPPFWCLCPPYLPFARVCPGRIEKEEDCKSNDPGSSPHSLLKVCVCVGEKEREHLGKPWISPNLFLCVILWSYRLSWIKHPISYLHHDLHLGNSPMYASNEEYFLCLLLTMEAERPKSFLYFPSTCHSSLGTGNWQKLSQSAAPFYDLADWLKTVWSWDPCPCWQGVWARQVLLHDLGSHPPPSMVFWPLGDSLNPDILSLHFLFASESQSLSVFAGSSLTGTASNKKFHDD